jgi:hypothetical protein
VAGTSHTAEGEGLGYLGRLSRWISRLGARSHKKEPEAKAPAKTDLEVLADSMADMRSLLRRTGAAFASAAGVILAGLGWTQVHQTFPLPEGAWTLPLPLVEDLGVSQQWVLGVVAAAAALAAFVGSAWFAARFFAAQRRILLASKISDCQGLDDDDMAALRRVYRSHASEELAPSVHAVELRAYRLKRMARAVPESAPRKKEWSAEADRLLDVVRLAIRRAAVAILEVRSSTAFAGPGTWIPLGMAITGIVFAFGVADYAKGERDLIQLRASCQDAVAKGAIDACDPVRSADAVDEIKAAADTKKEEAKAALADLRLVLQRGAERLERLEACISLLSSHDALAEGGDQVDAAVIQTCQILANP